MFQSNSMFGTVCVCVCVCVFGTGKTVLTFIDFITIAVFGEKNKVYEIVFFISNFNPSDFNAFPNS